MVCSSPQALRDVMRPSLYRGNLFPSLKTLKSLMLGQTVLVQFIRACSSTDRAPVSRAFQGRIPRLGSYPLIRYSSKRAVSMSVGTKGWGWARHSSCYHCRKMGIFRRLANGNAYDGTFAVVFAGMVSRDTSSSVKETNEVHLSTPACPRA